VKHIAVILLVTGMALGLSAGSAAAASPSMIGPHQLFIGFVNGSRSTPTIQMACFGPLFPGETGHPMSGQHVSVARTVDIPGGNTGALGTSIVVTFGPTAATTAGITLTHYGTKAAIPTSMTLPCGGQGTAVFQPRPGSRSARPDHVAVNFAGQP
jgi:hypothetical protein